MPDYFRPHLGDQVSHMTEFIFIFFQHHHMTVKSSKWRPLVQRADRLVFGIFFSVVIETFGDHSKLKGDVNEHVEHLTYNTSI